jgi:hypothetical protein
MYRYVDILLTMPVLIHVIILTLTKFKLVRDLSRSSLDLLIPGQSRLPPSCFEGGSVEITHADLVY